MLKGHKRHGRFDAHIAFMPGLRQGALDSALPLRSDGAHSKPPGGIEQVGCPTDPQPKLSRLQWVQLVSIVQRDSGCKGNAGMNPH